VLAAAHAASFLRALPGGALGLDATEEGAPPLQLSDLLTLVTTYASEQNATLPSSNSLGAYFHALGGHAAANSYLHRTIGGADDESFGGNYGENIPVSLGYSLHPAGGGAATALTPDPTPSPPISNHMSCLTMAEWRRRIVFTREASNGADGLTWTYSQALLYGAERSVEFPPLQWGGMTQANDVYQQAALNMSVVDERRRWRIFS